MIYLIVGLVALVSVIAIVLEVKAKKKEAQTFVQVQEQLASDVVSQVVEATPTVVVTAPKKKAAAKKAAKTTKTAKKSK